MLPISDISIFNISKIFNFNIHIKYGHSISFIEIFEKVLWRFFSHNLIISIFWFLLLKEKNIYSNIQVNSMKKVEFSGANNPHLSLTSKILHFYYSFKMRPQLSRKKSLLWISRITHKSCTFNYPNQIRQCYWKKNT